MRFVVRKSAAFDDHSGRRLIRVHHPRSLLRRYRSPQLTPYGALGDLVRGSSWKGVDSTGELDPDEAYPG